MPAGRLGNDARLQDDGAARRNLADRDGAAHRSVRPRVLRIDLPRAARAEVARLVREEATRRTRRRCRSCRGAAHESRDRRAGRFMLEGVEEWQRMRVLRLQARSRARCSPLRAGRRAGVHLHLWIPGVLPRLPHRTHVRHHPAGHQPVLTRRCHLVAHRGARAAYRRGAAVQEVVP